MTEAKRFSLAKPTLTTPFRIDFDWWRNSDQEWRVHLRSCLCPEHQLSFSDLESDLQVDFVDPETAEVQQVDGLQHILISHCSQASDFITVRTTLIEAIFRLFLANGNLQMTAVELGERLHRPPVMILRTLSGIRVYKGIRPFQDS